MPELKSIKDGWKPNMQYLGPHKQIYKLSEDWITWNKNAQRTTKELHITHIQIVNTDDGWVVPIFYFYK